MKKIHIPLEDQVISLEEAPKFSDALKKAGVEIVPNWYWNYGRVIDGGGKLIMDWKFESKKTFGKICIPTYTLDEVMAVLPKQIPSGARGIYSMTIWPYNICYHSSDYGILRGTLLSTGVVQNEVTAASKLFVWCVKEGYAGGEV